MSIAKATSVAPVGLLGKITTVGRKASHDYVRGLTHR